MKVTEVRVVKLNRDDTQLKAYASVCFDGVLVVDGYRVIQKDDKLMVSMPSKTRVDAEGKRTHRNTSYALDPDLRQEILETVKAAYLELAE